MRRCTSGYDRDARCSVGVEWRVERVTIVTARGKVKCKGSQGARCKGGGDGARRGATEAEADQKLGTTADTRSPYLQVLTLFSVRSLLNEAVHQVYHPSKSAHTNVTSPHVYGSQM